LVVESEAIMGGESTVGDVGFCSGYGEVSRKMNKPPPKYNPVSIPMPAFNREQN
jgi:hypothetical protein